VLESGRFSAIRSLIGRQEELLSPHATISADAVRRHNRVKEDIRTPYSRDADRIIGMVEAEEKGPARLVINRIKPEMVRRGDMLAVDDILELLAVQLVGMVPDDESVLTSTNRGTPVVLDGKSKAGLAFRNIARRLMGEEVPFLNMEDGGGFFSRLTRLIRPGGS